MIDRIFYPRWIQRGLGMRVGGIVLCGGRSSRMGRSKAWLPFTAELMLPRVVRLLRQAVDPVVVVAAQEQALPTLPADIAILRDKEVDRGPMAGLAVGLENLQNKVDAVYLSGCDVPLLRSAFVKRMIDLIGDYQMCIPRTDHREHPLAGVYRVELAAKVQSLLCDNRLRMSDLFTTAATRFVAAAEWFDVDPTNESLRNCNTPADYEAALRELTHPR